MGISEAAELVSWNHRGAEAVPCPVPKSSELKHDQDTGSCWEVPGTAG